jgi:N6-adenosine-specific RNA methylase IME4
MARKAEKNAEPAAVLKLLPLAEIHDHPDNPRLVYNEEVIEGIAANLNGAWPQPYALHVRPFEGEYQLVSGHQRKRAALKAELKEVWAWVEDLTDEEALMRLVTANLQGELSPLEIGLHVLRAVPLTEGGRGKKGGLNQYAKSLGKSHQYISLVRTAALVYRHIETCKLTCRFLDRATHLAEIHSVPESAWLPLIESLLQSEADANLAWTVERTKAVVKRLLASLEEVGEWKASFLSAERLAPAVVLKQKEPRFFKVLARTADLIVAFLEEHRKVLPVSAEEDFRTWLVVNAGALSWDVAELQKYRRQLEATLEEGLPAGIYDVILADPPWDYEFSPTDQRQIENKYPPMPLEEILALEVPAADNAVLFLWATAPKLEEALSVLHAWGFSYKTGAVWDKEKIGMGYWFRGQHELLLVGTKGHFSPPEDNNRISSVFREERRGHSVKPECVYRALEAMLPDARRLELFARGAARPGWTAWGNEVTNGEAADNAS